MRLVEVGFVVGLILVVLTGLIVVFFSIVGWDFVHTKLRQERREDETTR